MEVFRPPKKGRRCRKNQAWKGYEVDGGGRRRGCTFGRVPGVCVARGDHARRRSVEDGACSAAWGRRAAVQAQTLDRGQSLRCRLASHHFVVARHRVDLSASRGPKAPSSAGWSQASAVQATMDRGAHDRLAGQLPPTADSMGTTPSYVPSLHECRLPPHHRQTVMKPVLLYLAIAAASDEHMH